MYTNVVNKNRCWLSIGRFAKSRHGVALFALFLAFNFVAWMQARAMTHFVADGTKIPKIEELAPLQKIALLFTGMKVARPQNHQQPDDLGLAYTTVTLTTTQQSTLEAWRIDQSNSQGVILLFPGYAESKETLLATAQAFHQQGYTTLLVDFRGVGGSSGSHTTLGVREAEDVATSVAFARSTWPDQPLILLGMSMGSVAILRAIHYHDVRPAAIILESPFNRLLDTVRNRFRLMGLPASPASELLLFWGSLQQGFNGFRHNPVEDAVFVTCPAVVLIGENDTRATPAQAQAVFAEMRGAKRFVVFPTAKHELLFEANPALWQENVQWLFDRTLESIVVGARGGGRR